MLGFSGSQVLAEYEASGRAGLEPRERSREGSGDEVPGVSNGGGGSRARKPRRDAPKAECLSYAADTMSEDAQRPSRMVEAAGVEPAGARFGN